MWFRRPATRLVTSVCATTLVVLGAGDTGAQSAKTKAPARGAADSTRDSAQFAPRIILGSDRTDDDHRFSAWLVIPATRAARDSIVTSIVVPRGVDIAIAAGTSCDGPIASAGGSASWRGVVGADTMLTLCAHADGQAGTRLIASVARGLSTKRQLATIESDIVHPPPRFDLPPVPMAVFSALIGLMGGVAAQVLQRKSEDRIKQRGARESVELMIAREFSTELIANERSLRDYMTARAATTTGTLPQPPVLSLGGLNELYSSPSALAYLRGDARSNYFTRLEELVKAMRTYNLAAQHAAPRDENLVETSAKAAMEKLSALNSSVALSAERPQRLLKFFGQ